MDIQSFGYGFANMDYVQFFCQSYWKDFCIKILERPTNKKKKKSKLKFIWSILKFKWTVECVTNGVAKCVHIYGKKYT